MHRRGGGARQPKGLLRAGLNGPNFLAIAPDEPGPLDGMPDYWEIQHSAAGLWAGLSNAPTADFDGDGFTDLEEYVDVVYTTKVTKSTKEE